MIRALIVLALAGLALAATDATVASAGTGKYRRSLRPIQDRYIVVLDPARLPAADHAVPTVAEGLTGRYVRQRE